ncbi:MAG: metalloregulator ArsR/SmtB family transcription factor [Candidatus Bathyarchaeota archaeon]|nr:metalloregulator ArsR/SmtB family transcription factor [Candidatus Bathyarchaeota archaeon]
MTPTANNPLKFKAKIFYALSDPARIDVLEFLGDQEKCVCKIVPHLNMPQPLVSRHLKILRDAGIVRCRKDGTKRMYSVIDQRIFNIIDALNSELLDSLSKAVIENLTTCP